MTEREAHEWDSLDNCVKCGKAFVGYESAKGALDCPGAPETPPMAVVIYMNSNAKMSRGKYAAQAVHAALTAFGVHPDLPVIVLGAPRTRVEQMRTTIRDAGRTEVEPGTLTAGTNWPHRDPKDDDDE